MPAAITNSAPEDALSALTAWLIGSVPSVASPPRLMLITLAPEAAAHSMPSMICESLPEPSSDSTLPMISWAPGATPLCLPPAAAPEPAMVEATWVPWPWPSGTSDRV